MMNDKSANTAKRAGDIAAARVRPVSNGVNRALNFMLPALICAFICVQSAFAVPLDAYQSYARALVAQRGGDFESALAEYKHVIDIDNNAAVVYRDLALLYWQMGKAEDSFAAADKLKELEGEDVSAQLFLGSFYVMTGKAAAAKESLEKVLKLDPGNETALLYLAFYHTENDPEKSLEYWDDYIKRQPGYADGWQQMGVTQQKLGQIENAQVSFGKAVALAPENLFARLALAENYEKQRKFDEAVEQYDKFMTLDPKNSAVAVHLAGLYYELKKFDSSVEMFLKARDLNPKDNTINYWLGVVSEEKKDTDSAIKYFELFSRETENAIIFSKLGYLYSVRKDYKNSVRCLKKSLEIDPNNTYGYFLLGLNYMDTRQYKDAEKNIARAVELKPDIAEAHFQLGIIYDLTGKFDKAVPRLEKAVELKPDFATALNYLGYSLADRDKELDKAEGLIKRALALDTTNSAFQDSLGWVYYKKGDYAGAEKLLKTASENNNDPIIFEHYGDALVKLDKNAEAWDAYQSAYFNDPKNKKLSEKLKKMESLVMPKTIQRKLLKRAVGNLLQVRTLRFNFSLAGVISSNNIHSLGTFTYLRPGEWRIDVLGSFFAPKMVIIRKDVVKIFPEALSKDIDARAMPLFDKISGYFNADLLESFDSDQTVSEKKNKRIIYSLGGRTLVIDSSNGFVSEYSDKSAVVKFGKYSRVEGIYLPAEMDIFIRAEKSSAKMKFRQYILNEELDNGIFEINPQENKTDSPR
ncbi:MAG: tetratricopeptide repeat protein [Elusimicrobiota bacterium]